MKEYFRGLQGTNQCAVIIGGDPCTNRATTHVLLGYDFLEDASLGACCTLRCSEHEYRDATIGQHEVGSDCDMPGSAWYDEGCRVPK